MGASRRAIHIWKRSVVCCLKLVLKSLAELRFTRHTLHQHSENCMRSQRRCISSPHPSSGLDIRPTISPFSFLHSTTDYFSQTPSLLEVQHPRETVVYRATVVGPSAPGVSALVLLSGRWGRFWTSTTKSRTSSSIGQTRKYACTALLPFIPARGRN